MPDGTVPAPRPLPVPRVDGATVVVEPAAAGRGHWAGAPSACIVDGAYYLAYRLRRPAAEGRGHEVVVARSENGIDFETLAELTKESFGAASLERPALVVKPDGSWRLYVSCATPGSDHWWIDALDAADPTGFDPERRATVLPGSPSEAVKDPVVQVHDGRWMAWVCCHPLDDPSATDRMYTAFAASPDGLANWCFSQRAFRGSAHDWDSRGARVADVVRCEDGSWVAYYDGRSTKEDNAEERTGTARGTRPDELEAAGDAPSALSPWGSGSLRYVSVARTDGRPARLYFEACLPDGSHSLMTQAVESV